MLSRDVLAAGAVVVRAKGTQVLLVHRPKYDDWSFPKGKLDPGEHVTTAAVREVLEEAGVEVRLGRPLPQQRYGLGNGRQKVVHYWVGHPLSGHDEVDFVPNAEVDEVRWLGWDEAEALLSYRRDRTILAAARPVARRTHPVVVLRHGKAMPRGEADRADERRGGGDRARGLHATGHQQAADLVALLLAHGVRAVHTSTSTRCLDTVLPYARRAGLDVHGHECLTEEGHDDEGIRDLLASLAAGRDPVVVCSHRPVLPSLLEALGTQPVKLAPGELVVAQVRKGVVVSTQVLQPGETRPEA
ncbi:MAG: NUDIX domain-containing protein [Nocardioides sp.]|uniref:NUDIX domain-containing protein n=1 Tax=Nocardioides sp. TaxID=35761 RepID=UPI003F09155C